MNTAALKLHEQRFMVSPCGFYADHFHVDQIAEEAPDWTDCTHLSDDAINELMVRRMQASTVVV